jgi:hypothetical protein
MKDVKGVDFGEWNATVFWLVEHLKSRYGRSCVLQAGGHE